MIAIVLERRSYMRGLEAIVDRSRSVQRVLRRLKKPLKKQLLENAAAERSDEGRWKGRASKRTAKPLVERGRTRKASKRRGPRSAVRFIDRGKLLGSAPQKIKYSVRGGELKAESTIRNKRGVKLGPILHHGAKVGRGSVIPPRPFLYLPKAFIPLAEDQLAEHVFGGWAE